MGPQEIDQVVNDLPLYNLFNCVCHNREADWKFSVLSSHFMPSLSTIHLPIESIVSELLIVADVSPLIVCHLLQPW